MEVRLTELPGVPTDAVVSLRFGSVRRQAKLQAALEHPFRFPNLQDSCEPLKIEVLQTICSTRLVVHPSRTKYRMAFDGRDVAVGLSVQQVGSKEPVPAKMAGKKESDLVGDLKFKDTASSAREYFEKHGVLQYVQALLHAMIQERPEDPFVFMLKQLSSSRSLSKKESTKPTEPPAADPRVRVTAAAAVPQPEAAAPPRQQDDAVEVQAAGAAAPPAVLAEDEARGELKRLLVEAYETGGLERAIKGALQPGTLELAAAANTAGEARENRRMRSRPTTRRAPVPSGELFDTEGVRMEIQGALFRAAESGDLLEALQSAMPEEQPAPAAEAGAEVASGHCSPAQETAAPVVENGELTASLQAAPRAPAAAEAQFTARSDQEKPQSSSSRRSSNKGASALLKGLRSGEVGRIIDKAEAAEAAAAAAPEEGTAQQSAKEVAAAPSQEVATEPPGDEATLGGAEASPEAKRVEEACDEELRMRVLQKLDLAAESGTLASALAATASTAVPPESAGAGPDAPRSGDAGPEPPVEAPPTMSEEATAAEGTLVPDGAAFEEPEVERIRVKMQVLLGQAAESGSLTATLQSIQHQHDAPTSQLAEAKEASPAVEPEASSSREAPQAADALPAAQLLAASELPADSGDPPA